MYPLLFNSVISGTEVSGASCVCGFSAISTTCITSLVVNDEAYYIGGLAFVKRKITKFHTFFAICMIITIPIPCRCDRFSRPVQNRFPKRSLTAPKTLFFLTMSTVLRISTFKDVKNRLLRNCLLHGGKRHRKRQQGSLLSETGANMPRNSRNTVKDLGLRCSPGSHDGIEKNKNGPS